MYSLSTVAGSGVQAASANTLCGLAVYQAAVPGRRGEVVRGEAGLWRLAACVLAYMIVL